MTDQVFISRPYTRISWQDLKEIWVHRDLLLMLCERDIRVRYKQTFVGILWVVIQPLLTTSIFAFFFGRLGKIPGNGLPYALSVLIGLVFWNYFSNALTHASNSLIDNEGIIKKVYFPRLILPLSGVVSGLVDFGVNFLLLNIVALLMGVQIGPKIWLTAVLALTMTLVAALGAGILLSALNVRYRDVRYALPFVFQVLIFVTPVIYPLSIVAPANQLVMALNPMTSVIEMMRSAFGSAVGLDLRLVTVSLACEAAILAGGLFYFRKTEREFADVA